MKKIYVLLLIILLTNCKKSEPPTQNQTIELTFWHTMNEEESKTLGEIIDIFEVEHPNVNITSEYIAYEEARDTFLLSVSSGNSPDILRAEIAWLPEFVQKESLLPLTKYITAEDKKDFIPAAFSSSHYKDEIWGIPQVTDVLALFYNKRLLKEAGYTTPPKTIKEFEEVCTSIKTKLNIEGFYARSSYYWYLPFLYSFGGDLITENGIEVDSEKSISSLEYIVSENSLFFKSSDISGEYSEQMNMFVTGEVAMIINGPWATSGILEGAEFTDKNNLGVTTFPKGEFGEMGSPVGGHQYVVTAETNYAKQSYDFIEFINRAEYQELFAINNNLLPTRKSAYELPGTKNNKLIRAFLKQMQYGKARPNMPSASKLYEILSKYVQLAWDGTLPADEALHNVADEWELILKK
ncbi:MAG: extracellular solute-binding protein [Spirochaetaceae bacterium]